MRCSFLSESVHLPFTEACGKPAASAWVHRFGSAFFYCRQHAAAAERGSEFGRAGYSLLSMEEYAVWRVLES